MYRKYLYLNFTNGGKMCNKLKNLSLNLKIGNVVISTFNVFFISIVPIINLLSYSSKAHCCHVVV